MKHTRLMRRTATVLGVILIALAAVGFALRHGKSAPIAHEAAAGAGAGPSGALGVEEFMHNLGSHPGRVRVQGVVSDVQPGAHLVVLIDRKEWEQCGEVGCASLSLPVRWAGTMPRVEEGIAVSGEVKEDVGKLVFVADALEQVSGAPAARR